MRISTLTLLAAAVAAASTAGAQNVNTPVQGPGARQGQAIASDTPTTPSQTPSVPPSQTPAETHASPPAAPPMATQTPAQVGSPNTGASPSQGVDAPRTPGATTPITARPSVIPSQPSVVPAQPSAIPPQLNTPPIVPSAPNAPNAPNAPSAPTAPGGTLVPIKR